MKKLFAISSILILLMIGIFSCSEPGTAYVTVTNYTGADLFWAFGGIKYGDAEFIGELQNGYYWPAKVTKPGSYYLQMQDVSGNWMNQTVDTRAVADGQTMDICIYGTGVTSDINGNFTGATSIYFTTSVHY